MLNIFYGRENLDKEKFIFSNLGKRALIIVPDQYTLEAERQTFRHLGVEALMDVEILSPTRLGSRILGELGGGRKNFIDKYGRHMLLYKSALRQRESLHVFRGMEKKASFLESVNNFISEMKQYGCGAEDLLTMANEGEKDSYTQQKLMDIYTLFADYEKQIEGKYTDSEDYVDLYINRVSESGLVRDNQIWIYGFDSFAPKTMALVGQLMACAADVNLVITYDRGGKDEELFDLADMIIYQAEKLADSLGVEYRRQAIPEEYDCKEKKLALAHLEKELYAVPASPIDDVEGVTLVEAANIYNEAESAASYILHLVRDKGLRYRDILLLCNDMETRGEILVRVFEEYGIPLFTDIKKDILSNPAVQTIISLLDVVVEKYRTEDIFKLLKSGFGDLSSDELAELENYSIKYKIKGYLWKKPFLRGKSEYGEEELAALEVLRQRAINPVLPLEPIFRAESTDEFIKGFYKYLTDQIKLPEKILAFIGEQEEKGFWDLADETAQIWQSLVNILDQIYDIMGNDEFEADAFRDIFVTGLSQVQIGLLPPTEDGLVMGTVQRSRSGRVKAVVVVGANEGILPQEKPTQGIFSAEEREFFRQKGRELCKVDSVRFMEEKMAIYRNLTGATDYLWMSYSIADGEGNQTKPSSVFGKMKELFPGVQVEKDVLNREDAKALINSKTSGLRHLSKALQDLSEGIPVSSQWAETLRWFEENKQETIEKLKEGIAFTNKQEALGSSAAEAIFKKDLTKAMSLSPSRLEKFSRCPFSHLVLYGLRPEERRIFEVAPREIGDIYHQCLMEMTKELTVDGLEITDEKSPWMTITREECDQIVSKEMEKIASEYREGVFVDNAASEYRAGRALEICQEVCWTAVEQVRCGHIKSIMPEVAFGRFGKIPPITVELDTQKVFIEGVIDRVDMLSDDKVKIIDYKTGNESFSVAEAEQGYRLQLMLYLQAACKDEYKPAGVFYFKIKEPSIDLSARDIDKEALEKEIRKSFKLDGVMVDDPLVIKDIAGEFEGFSEIVPIRATKEGIKNSGKEGLLTEEEFAALQKAVRDNVGQAVRDLMDGKIQAHPMKTKERSACAFCQYKGICRFDTVFDNCKYNIIR